VSNALAISAVTTTLRNLLETGINVGPGLGFTRVTARPPDRARAGEDEQNQLNLFLYQTSVNAAWRNRDMPGRVRPGEQGHPPLALNLHYLITAYGSGGGNEDLLAHRVLGRAMSVLHDNTVLDQDDIQAALEDAGLHEQVERVRITPLTLSLEELSKLWSSFQTQYRVSAAYEVAVVLIESTRPLRAALPVLRRGERDEGPQIAPDPLPFPRLTALETPFGEPAATIGDTLRLRGGRLDGSQLLLRFVHQRRESPLTKTLTGVRPDLVEFSLTNPTDNDQGQPWLAGIYRLSAVVSRPDERDKLSNELAFALAPTLSITPNSAPEGDLALDVTVTPPVTPEQPVALLFGSQEIAAAPRAATTSSLSFVVPGVTRGDYYVRLRVDGVDSALLDRTARPPRYLDGLKVTIT
jgi:hypothetical protein